MIANSSLTVQRLVTIPTNATAPIVVGSVIDICSTNEGNLKLSPDAGVNLNGKPHIFGQFSMMRLIKTATDSWTSIPFGSRRGRTPKIRLRRTGSAFTYPTNTETAIPYDTVDTGQTFNPDNEWFAPPAGGYATERRAVVKQTGEYQIILDFVGTLTSQQMLRIVQMTASNTIGNFLALGVTFTVGQGIWTGRLTANDTVGCSHFPSGASNSDFADSASAGKNSITIVRIGD